MLLLNLALIAAFLPFLLSRLLELPRADPLVALAVVYVFAAAPVRANLEHGQVNLAVLALIAAAWLGLKRERGGALAAALPLSLAILLKTYPAVALVYLALQRRFRVVGMTCALLLAFSLVSLALVPASAWGHWFHNVLPTEKVDQPGASTSQSGKGCLAEQRKRSR